MQGYKVSDYIVDVLSGVIDLVFVYVPKDAEVDMLVSFLGSITRICDLAEVSYWDMLKIATDKDYLLGREIQSIGIVFCLF